MHERNEDISNAADGMLRLAKRTATVCAVVALMIIILLGMLASQPQVYQQGLLRLIPPSQRTRGRKILGEIGSSLQWFLSAKAVAMVLVGVLTGLGLFLLGVELAATLAIIAALLTFIPNFGPIVSAVPAVLLGLMHSPMTALWVVVLFIVIQLIESYLITPLIQYRALSLPPVLVITAQLAASVWMGVLGLVVATPLLIVAIVLVRNLYLEGVLQEDVSGSEDNSP